ncbi:VOC family protein [Halobacteria archaeon AArc-curdl1]|uniref:VOC family protein n=1 Tax=Natronosalvus hydrolyticus TaxID=2979988 RepID=A0AAP2Z974_9EURY|nr:VOC family protein [Halobacteria archaeon AArc-curdl1]
MKLTGIDHFVRTVEDVGETCTFCEELGAEVETFREGYKAVHFGEQKITIHPVDTDIDLVAGVPTVGGGDLCLIAETTIEEVERRLTERDISRDRSRRTDYLGLHQGS